MTHKQPPRNNHANLKLSLRLLARDWRSGALTILVFSLLLAVATVTSISLFTSRIHNSIYDEAAQFLAGSVKISGSIPIEDSWLNQAETLNIETALITEFTSMAFSEQEMILTQVKAVSSSYPLKGEMTIAKTPYGAEQKISGAPKEGEAWLASRLFEALGISIGDKIFLGDGEFIVTAAVVKEPDAGQSLFGIAPRAMINHKDIAKTNAVQVGSRISYSLLISGSENRIDKFQNWIDPKLGHHFRWNDAKSSNRSVGGALDRAESFLLLAGSLSVILGCAAIALAARRYAQKNAKTVAVLKTLGYTPNDVLTTFSLILITLGLSGVLAGSLLGWVLHWGILIAIGNLIPTQLMAPSFSAYWTGYITGFVALLAFAAPPFFSLRNVLPKAAINDSNQSAFNAFWANLLGLAAIVLLVFLYSRDPLLTLYLTIGSIICLQGVFLLSKATISFSQRFAKKLNYTWRLGFNNLQRHQKTNAMQIMIFSILLLLVAILISVRTHLIAQWKNQLPPNAANHFAFNIFPDELEDVKQAFAESGVTHSPFYAMTRGRIVAVNGESTAERVAKFNEGGMDYEREINLTSSQEMGPDNTIESGQWWTSSQLVADAEFLVSTEEGYAKGLGIEVDDLLLFSIAGQELTARVTSIRSVQWDSMNPNFFMIFNQAIDKKYGANWLTSFHIDANQKTFLNQLTRKYPTISLIELDQTINQIRDIINKITTAIEFILMLVVISGLLVLITSIQATLDMRFKESAILRTLGAEKALVRKTLITEFSVLGLLAGLLAVVGTEACLFLLQTLTFELQYQPFFIIWLALPIAGALLIGATGWVSTRRVTQVPPMHVLKSIN